MNVQFNAVQCAAIFSNTTQYTNIFKKTYVKTCLGIKLIFKTATFIYKTTRLKDPGQIPGIAIESQNHGITVGHGITMGSPGITTVPKFSLFVKIFRFQVDFVLFF